jgi:non-specific protein-tyrosine kinase
MKIRVALEKAAQHLNEAKTRHPNVTLVTPGAAAYMPVHRSVHIPMDTRQARDQRVVVGVDGAPEHKAYQFLRGKMALRIQQQGFNTVLITSPHPGDGKTLTTVNLALTCAGAYDQTVLVVDCDLRRPTVCRTLGVETRVGLGDYLLDHVPLHEVITWPGIEKMTLISGGAPVDRSAEVLGSKRMHALVKELKARYDNRLVLFDTPALLAFADTLALLPLVDSIILVVAEGSTRVQDLRKAIESVPEEKLLGVVLNRQKQGV